MRINRRFATIASTLGMVAALALGLTFAATADEEPPSEPPPVVSDAVPESGGEPVAEEVRAPPRADGSVPPEPDPAGVRRDQAEAEALYSLSEAEYQRAAAILGKDQAFRALIGEARYSVESKGPWTTGSGNEPNAIGAFYNIKFERPFSKENATVPVLIPSESDSNELEPSSYQTDLKNIVRMTVTVRFKEDAVVDVQVDTNGTTSTMTQPEGEAVDETGDIPSTVEGEEGDGLTESGEPE